MKFLKTLLEKQKSKTQHAKELDISSTFYVKEKDGKLWILHNGYAIRELDPSLTVEDVVKLLTMFRSTAIRY